jgi:hypothetical protein
VVLIADGVKLKAVSAAVLVSQSARTADQPRMADIRLAPRTMCAASRALIGFVLR